MSSTPLPVKDRILSFDGTPLRVHALPRGRATEREVGEKDAPAKRPRLLVANGIGAGPEALNPLLSHETRFDAVGWDYRGLFASGRPVGGYPSLELPHHARDALAIMDELGWENAHVLGWSMGVAVALEMVRRAPERVSSLVLVAGSAGRPYRSVLGAEARGAFVERRLLRGLRWAKRNDGLARSAVRWAGGQRALVPALVRAGLCHHEVDRALFERLAAGFGELDMHVFLEQLHRLGEHDAWDVLPQIRCPTAVLVGTADALTPMHQAERMHATIPNSRLFRVAGATHYVPLEMAKTCARILGGFWDDAVSDARGSEPQTAEEETTGTKAPGGCDAVA